MSLDIELLPVPTGDKAVYALAESYFVERLTANYRPKGYDCYREYEYAGGTSWMPTTPNASSTDKNKARILKMLQGGEGAYGFRHLDLKKKKGKWTERGHQKADFLAFRAHDGVVGEVGTAAMRVDKTKQLQKRLHSLKDLVDEELKAQSFATAGGPVCWHGMSWHAAKFIPPEGPVVIPVDSERLITTAPTFEPITPGVYLYQLFRYRGHRQTVGDPIPLPRFSKVDELKQAWRRYVEKPNTPPQIKPIPGAPKVAPRQSGWLEGWPGLRDELIGFAKVLGVVVVVVAVIAVIIVASPAVAAAGAALAGFAAALAATLEQAVGAQGRVLA